MWLKGILQNQFGVPPREIDWYVAELDIAEESQRPPPADVRVSFVAPPRTREHAIELLEKGEIMPRSSPTLARDALLDGRISQR